MALDIQRLQREPAGGVYTSPVRLCLDADGALVDCNDPSAARLLVGEGCELPMAEAERYGLLAVTEDEAQIAGYLNGRLTFRTRRRLKPGTGPFGIIVLEPEPETEEETEPESEAPKRRRAPANKAAKGSEDKA